MVSKINIRLSALFDYLAAVQVIRQEILRYSIITYAFKNI